MNRPNLEKFMSNKKSYMNHKNLLAEGFFDKLFKLLRLRSSEDKAKLKRSKDIQNSLASLNKNWDDLENYVSDVTGKPFKFSTGKFTLKDFL